MKWGIRAQVLLVLCLVLSFGLFASYWVTSDVTMDAVLQSSLERLEQTAQVAKGAHQSGSIQAMNTAISPDQVLVVDKSGAVLAPTGGTLDPAVARLVGEGKRTSALVAVQGAEWLLYQVPAGHGREERIVVVAPMAKINARISVLENLLLLFTLVIMLLAIIPGYVVLGRLVVHPLQRLVRMVDGVGGGEFTQESDVQTPGNEVQQLVLALERMKTQLAQDREKIEHQIEQLQGTNAELRAAKEQLILTEKLATVGTLAAGIAHEIGNPLAVLQGYGELLNDADLPETKRVEYARAVEVAVEKVSTIIRDLLEFARPVDQSDDTCDVARATQRAINLVTHQPSFRSIDIRFEESPESLLAKINGGRLEQVLLNLLLNASHASPKGATVAVRIGEEAKRIVLEVTDEGEGIPAGIQSKIFDPFFTTKEPGSGTGLGLSICHNIITGFDGTISFKSREGQGTTFRIELPRVEPGER